MDKKTDRFYTLLAMCIPIVIFGIGYFVYFTFLYREL